MRCVLSPNFLNASKLDQLDTDLVLQGISHISSIGDFANSLAQLKKLGVKRLLITDNAIDKSFMAQFKSDSISHILMIIDFIEIWVNNDKMDNIADVGSFMVKL